jgi:hypothetical protein
LPRRIIYHPEFDADTIPLGGIIAVQRAITPLIAALEQNPYIFSLLDITSGLRYAGLRATEGMPSLLIGFIVDEDEDVILRSIARRG